MRTIAFIGLGAMGYPMAVNLASAGFALRVFDLNAAAVAALADAGCQASLTALEAVGEADIVITMLPNDAAVESFYAGPMGILAALRSGSSATRNFVQASVDAKACLAASDFHRSTSAK